MNQHYILYWQTLISGLPRELSGKDDTRDAGSIPGWGRSPGERNNNPLQYSCLETPMDREVWRARAHRVAKSFTWLSTHTHKLTSIYKYMCIYILFYYIQSIFMIPLIIKTSFGGSDSIIPILKINKSAVSESLEFAHDHKAIQW